MTFTAEVLAKLLIEKGVITQTEFMQKLSAERGVYQAMVEKNEVTSNAQNPSFGGFLLCLRILVFLVKTLRYD